MELVTCDSSLTPRAGAAPPGAGWGAETRYAAARMDGMRVYRLLGRSAVGLPELLSGGWVNHPKVIQE